MTLWEPYAKAIALGLKKFETRNWAIKYRGLLAIHSSIKPLCGEYRKLADKYGLAGSDFGKISAVCELKDRIPMTDELISGQPQKEKDSGDWRVGRYAWLLDDIRVLDKPPAAKGHQRLWNIDLAA